MSSFKMFSLLICSLLFNECASEKHKKKTKLQSTTSNQKLSVGQTKTIHKPKIGPSPISISINFSWLKYIKWMKIFSQKLFCWMANQFMNVWALSKKNERLDEGWRSNMAFLFNFKLNKRAQSNAKRSCFARNIYCETFIHQNFCEQKLLQFLQIMRITFWECVCFCLCSVFVFSTYLGWLARGRRMFDIIFVYLPMRK